MLWITNTPIQDTQSRKSEIANDHTKESKRTGRRRRRRSTEEEKTIEGGREEVQLDGRGVSKRRREGEIPIERTSRRHPPACFLLQHSSSMPARCIETEAEELPSGTSRTRVLEGLPNRKLFDFRREERQPASQEYHAG